MVKAMISKIRYDSHEEWLALRKNYIGGSDAGAVAGLNPYCSAWALWAEKTNRVPAFEGNIATKVGSYLEEFVAKLFTEETGKKVRRENAMLVNDDYPFACADVDRLIVGERSLLEIKTTTSLPAMRKIRGGEFPEQWWCQVCHYLAVTGYEKAYLAVLVNCRELKIYELERDDAEIEALMSAERAFWSCVTTDTPPAPDGAESTTDALTTIYADSIESTCNLFGRETLLAEYMALKQRNKENDARIAEIQNVICEEMQDAERGECGAYTVSWKAQERSTFQRKEFEKAHPEIDLSQYFKTSKSRPFKVTENKE